MTYTSRINTPIGILTIAADGKNLTGLWMFDQKYYGSTLDNNHQENNTLPIILQTKKWIEQYFEGKNPKLSGLPLAPQGSDFRQLVWRILCSIPYGQTTTYGNIAKIIKQQTGKNASAQAVGGAVGHNPIGIIIPCHRVIGTNGSLTGYAGGINKKIHLLKLEGSHTPNLFIPAKGTAL